MDAIIKKIKALLETRGCTEAEAEARMAKAQELLAKYNLEMANVTGASTDTTGKRKDAKTSGGLYTWQRNLWKHVAELNFCYYLSVKGLARGAKYEHRLIGSHANVVATEVMAQYLQETVERLSQQWAKDNHYRSVFVREAIAYREGMTNNICSRLRQRRIDDIAQQEQQEKQRRAADPGTTALTIVDVISTEGDFNNDYLNNWEPGTTARNRKEAAERQRKWEEKYAAEQAAKSPEQVLREAKELQEWYEKYLKKQARRKPSTPHVRAKTAEEKRQGLASYWHGYDDGAKVGIDQQASHEKKEALR